MTEPEHQPAGQQRGFVHMNEGNPTLCRYCGYDLLLFLNRRLVCVRCGSAAIAAPSRSGGSGDSEADLKATSVRDRSKG